MAVSFRDSSKSENGWAVEVWKEKRTHVAFECNPLPEISDPNHRTGSQ